MGPQIPAFRSSPGLAIGFLQECIRWWDHWLKGEATPTSWTSRNCAPGLRTRCRREPITPSARAGGWPSRSWPSPRIAPKVLHLNADGLGVTAGTAGDAVHLLADAYRDHGGSVVPARVGRRPAGRSEERCGRLADLRHRSVGRRYRHPGRPGAGGRGGQRQARRHAGCDPLRDACPTVLSHGSAMAF